MTGGLYSFANLGGIECGWFRLKGVGLANCLFPWARAVLTSEKYGLRRIASTWPQLCHRQWLRRDRDKRCYAGLMEERGLIGGSRKLMLLATQPKISERDFLADPESFHRGVVTFGGIEGYFETMLEDHALVRALLGAATRPQHRPRQDAALGSICIHVRYGDATDPDSRQAATLKIPHHLRQRMSWFTHALAECRRHLRQEVPALVFSDASDDELRPLLAVPGVRRVFFGSAIADLLAMSSAPLLIASGSTFSMWAAYLGRMPVIWPRGQRRQHLHPGHPESEPEIDFDPLPEDFIALSRGKFRREEFARALA